jgi:hypothetical protein
MVVLFLDEFTSMLIKKIEKDVEKKVIKIRRKILRYTYGFS